PIPRMALPIFLSNYLRDRPRTVRPHTSGPRVEDTTSARESQFPGPATPGPGRREKSLQTPARALSWDENVEPPMPGGRPGARGSLSSKPRMCRRDLRRSNAGPVLFFRWPRAPNTRQLSVIGYGTSFRTPPDTHPPLIVQEFGDGTYQRHREVVLPGEGLRIPPAGERAGRLRPPQHDPGLRLQGPLRGRRGRVRHHAGGQGAEGPERGPAEPAGRAAATRAPAGNPGPARQPRLRRAPLQRLLIPAFGRCIRRPWRSGYGRRLSGPDPARPTASRPRLPVPVCPARPPAPALRPLRLRSSQPLYSPQPLWS